MGTEAFLGIFWARCQGADAQTWQGIEANLWFMSCVIDRVRADSVVAPQLLVALQGVGPENRSQLHHTALKVAGGLSSWAQTHPEAVPGIWAMLIKAVQAQKHISVVIDQIKTLCATCRAAVAPHLADLKAVCLPQHPSLSSTPSHRVRSR